MEITKKIMKHSKMQRCNYVLILVLHMYNIYSNAESSLFYMMRF